MVFANNSDVIILLEIAYPKFDSLWSCNDSYIVHYFTSEKETYESSLGAWVSIIARNLKKKVQIRENRTLSNIIVA